MIPVPYLVPDRRSKGQVSKSKKDRAVISVVYCFALFDSRIATSTGANYSFQIRINALLDSEALIPFLGQMSIPWMFLLLKWSTGNTDLTRKLGPMESDCAFHTIPGDLHAYQH